MANFDPNFSAWFAALRFQLGFRSPGLKGWKKKKKKREKPHVIACKFQPGLKRDVGQAQ